MGSKAVFLVVGLLVAIGGLVAVAGILDLGGAAEPKTPTGPENNPGTTPSTVTSEVRFRVSTEGLPVGGEWRGAPDLADLNKDGKLDIVCCVRKGDGLFVYLGDGQGKFQESIEGIPRNLGYGGSAIADYNGDSILDIAFSTHGTPIQVLLGSESGEWKAMGEGLTNRDIISDVAAGDLDGDGDVDLVGIAWSEGGLMLFENQGKGVWETKDLFPKDRRIFGKEVLLADIDADGNLDIIATYFGPKVFLGDGKGGFSDRSQGLPVPLTGGVFQGLDVADIDGDGKLELAVASMAIAEERLNGIGVFRLSEAGSWTDVSAGLPAGEHFYAVRFGDFDTDGRLDLAASGVQKRVEIFFGKEDGFKGRYTLPESSKRAVLSVGDFNNDGADDILEVYAFRPGGVRVWLQERGVPQVTPPGPSSSTH